jgi:acyl-CoA reductase-like NAD-dependent aldehyde dehydrogenase
LEAAERAFPGWARLSADQRGAYLWRASNILEERKEKIGRLLTREQGKPPKEAGGNEKAVEMSVTFLKERGPWQIILNQDPVCRALSRQPVGVVAAISPWNYPVELTGWKATPFNGCTIVLAFPDPLPLKYWECLADTVTPGLSRSDRSGTR